jgi:hypothetical protein
MLADDRKVTYDDLVHMLSGPASADGPSVLKAVYSRASGSDAILSSWLASDANDAEILEKSAGDELRKLIRSVLGLDTAPDAPLPKLRAITSRYLLAGEFRLDLRCAPPATLEGIPAPRTKDHEVAVRRLAERLRRKHGDAYVAIADALEAELGLRGANLPAAALGAIDTFRFEEKALLAHCGDLVCDGKFEDALGVAGERRASFWLDRDVGRRAQWTACQLMAELGAHARDVRASLAKTGATPRAWIEAYTADDGWHRMDAAHRHLEAWLSRLAERAERPRGVVRRQYEDTCQAMAGGFTGLLAKAGWTVPGVMHQTRVHADVVAQQPRPVAYFLVDAMRFEMGMDLRERLPPDAEIAVRPAVAALPSITVVGMAALQPGASASFSVVAQGGKLGALIDDVFLPDRPARTRFAAARLPKMVDIGLDDLLGLAPSKLAKKVEGAEIVVVRSQDIDKAGETHGAVQARRIMETEFDNLALAVRKLANAGVPHAVITADHGHLFASDRDESMRIDAPGGDTVELHRRCWIGRGGATPPGCVRVSAHELGYASDLDFVFPSGSGVFKAGGDLAFHHGGPSLQELIVPVVTIRLKERQSNRPSAGPVTATALPDAVTNRIAFQGQLALGTGSLKVRPVLIAGGKQVGAVGMAPEADFDRTTGCVTITPEKPVQVAFQLNDDSVASLRVVVQDPATDGELYRSPTVNPVRLGV